MEHLNRQKQKMKHVIDDIRSKNIFKNFPLIFSSVSYGIVNFKIQLHINLSTKDVLDFKQYRSFENEIICCNLPNLSLVSKHHRKSRKEDVSFLYICTIQ